MPYLRDLKGVTCVYCGQTMLTLHQILDYSKKATKLKGKKLIKFLSALEPDMKNNERFATKLIKETAKKNPDDDLKGLLGKMFPRHVARLEKQQTEVLLKLADTAQNFPQQDKDVVMAQIGRGLVAILKKEDNQHFKRNKYISEFYLLKDKFSDPQNHKMIVDTISSMPNTHTSIDAFVVKYSRKSTQEIMHRLLSPNQVTIEHLQPRSMGGKNEITNLVLACGKDNSSRRSKPLATMTNLEANLPDYFRTLKKNLSKRLSLQDFKKVDEYVGGVKETINSLLTGGLRICDNSKGR